MLKYFFVKIIIKITFKIFFRNKLSPEGAALLSSTLKLFNNLNYLVLKLGGNDFKDEGLKHLSLSLM